MPYIKQKERKEIDESSKNITTCGQLNYAITKLLHQYIKRHELNYNSINDVIGAIESAKAEFQRRVVTPYEELKIKENGDL